MLTNARLKALVLLLIVIPPSRAFANEGQAGAYERIPLFTLGAPSPTQVDSTSQDLARVVQLLELDPRRPTATPRVYSFVSGGLVFADRQNSISVQILPAEAMKYATGSLVAKAEANGPLRINPPSTLESATFVWRNKTIMGTQFRLDSPASKGIVDGDLVEIVVRLCYYPATATTATEDDCPEPPSSDVREAKIHVQFLDLGITHNEADSFVFVRSAQTDRWDARPGVSTSFGWKFRPTHKLRRLWNFVSPRAGVNVTLLDFDKDETGCRSGQLPIAEVRLTIPLKDL